MIDGVGFTLKRMMLSRDWTLIVQCEYTDYIDEHLKDFDQLITYAENKREDFRWFCELGTIQLFLGVYPSLKEIRVASKNLSKELALLSTQERELGKDFLEHINILLALPIENSPSYIEYLSEVKALPSFQEPTFTSLKDKVDNEIKKVVESIHQYRPSLFEKVSDFGLDLIANFNLIRVHLLKYLAILPNLDHDQKGDEVRRLAVETLERLVANSDKAKRKKLKGQNRALPSYLILAMQITLVICKLVPSYILARSIRFFVAMMAKRFIAGENIRLAKKSLVQLKNTNRSATIDQLGELVVSQVEAEDYCDKVLEIIEGLSNQGRDIDKNKAGILNAHVSIKISALTHHFSPQDLQYTFSHVYPRLKKILVCAKKHNVFINIDAEHYSYRDMIFDIYARTLETTQELTDFQQTGIVVQAYLRDAYEHLLEVASLAKRRGHIMPIRLVKGAYWDAETIEARAHNFDSPQFLNKQETDLHFRQLIFKTLEMGDVLQLAVASHNIQDHCFAKVLQEDFFKKAPLIEHQCLHMTYEGLSQGLANLGQPTRNYIPLGNLLIGMAYLVRRIMENSSQVGVLSIMRSHRKAIHYQDLMDEILTTQHRGDYVHHPAITNISGQFKNVYPVRSYLSKHRFLIKQELEKMLASLKQGKMIFNEGPYEVFSPSDAQLLLGRVDYDCLEDIDRKFEILFEGFMGSLWSKNFTLRQSVMLKVIDLLLIKRVELAVLIMLEAGKTIDEAIADVDEAIDFIQFYLVQYSGSESLRDQKPKGVIVAIAPWNFPLAIACGMSVAPLICGNTVFLKPAEQTPLVAKKFLQICHMAGVPDYVFQMSCGEGDVGKCMVEHPLSAGVVFTGSKQVGQEIYRKIGQQFLSDRYQHSQKILKVVMAEMGGKNAIIVTNNCEMDETIEGIIYSAFAHSGQKCSAASRIIIDNHIKEVFLKRFKQAIIDLKVGVASDFSTFLNPLIREEDKQRVRSMVKRARLEVESLGGEVLIDLSSENYPANCIGPSVFVVGDTEKLPDYTVANDEVFGPILHIIGYGHIDQGLAIFNSTQYALTGGVFCQSQDDLDYILPKLEVGNIYVNRPSTGARVGIEPFGGFKMSGTGPKAGGKEYLRNFLFKRKSNHFHISKEASSFDDFGHFDLARDSKRDFDSRKQIVHDLLKGVMLEKEALFQSEGFAFLTWPEKFYEFIRSGGVDILTNTYPNHTIPGQLSYTMKDMSLGNGLVIDSDNKIKMPLFIDFLMNLLIGNGMNIICLSLGAYHNWSEILNLAYKYGLSIYNVSLNQLTRDDCLRVIQTYSFKFLLLPNEEYDHDFIVQFIQKEEKLFLPRVIFSELSHDLSHRIDYFVLVRSFAINTMRHGAPMELDI